MVTVVPLCGTLEIESVPPCCLIIHRAMVRPNPVPSARGLVVKNASVILSSDSFLMPMPVSVMVTITVLSLICPFIEMP